MTGSPDPKPPDPTTPAPDAAVAAAADDAGRREQPIDPFIPIRAGDLKRMLLSEPGVAEPDRSRLDELSRRLGDLLHHRYFARLKRLLDLYSPLDPDSDCIDIQGDSLALTEQSDEAFLAPFEEMLLHANYRPLSTDEIQDAVAAPNELGLNYSPNFDLFEHLRVYVRGQTPVTRVIRNLATRFRRKPVVLDGYERVAVMLKFKEGEDLGPYVRPEPLYLRLFKDVPRVDMEMHLPEQGTRVRMRLVDKAQIASPFMIGLPTLLLKVVFTAIFSPFVVGGLLVGPITAGVNSFFGFQRAKQRHLHHMIRHLYYLNLANNASVITRITSAAEEEDYKEALLSFYFLWRRSQSGGAPYTVDELDCAVRAFLKEKLDMAREFEIDDALAKLAKLGLASIDPNDDRVTAPPIETAIERLRESWIELADKTET